MAPDEVGHGVEVEGIAERVRQHDGPRPRADGVLQAVGHDVGRVQADVEKHRHAAVL